MLRKSFDQEIQNTKNEIFVLGSMVEQAMLSLVNTLTRHDLRVAQQIIENDAMVNAICF